MIVCGHSGRMVPVLPESTFSAFTVIKFLARFSGNQLNRFRNRFIPVSGIIDKKVNMFDVTVKFKTQSPKRFLASNSQYIHRCLSFLQTLEEIRVYDSDGPGARHIRI